MQVILDTREEYIQFEELMARSTTVEYDLDEYASVFVQKLDELLATTGFNDVVAEVAHAYSTHRPLEDQKIFESAFIPLFQSAFDQLLNVQNVHEAHLSFTHWLGGNMVIDATLDL